MRDGVLAHVAVTAVELHPLVDGPVVDGGGTEPRCRGLLRGQRAGDAFGQAEVDEQLGGLDTGRDLGECVPGVLELRERPAEHRPLTDVVKGHREHRASRGDTQHSGPEIEVATQKLTSLIEPILIVILAVVVGFIVLSIIWPILQIGKVSGV